MRVRRQLRVRLDTPKAAAMHSRPSLDTGHRERIEGIACRIRSGTTPPLRDIFVKIEESTLVQKDRCVICVWAFENKV